MQRLLTVGEANSTTALLGYYLDEGLGASTRPNSKQPIERTVIELRYGKIATIDPFYLDSVGDYDLSRILVSGKWIRLDELISNYSDLRSENARAFKNYLQMRRKVIKVLFFPKRFFQFIQKKLRH